MPEIDSMTPRASRSRAIGAALLFFFTFVAARALLERPDLPDAARIAAALLPAGPFIWVLWEIFRGVRALDELGQRIQLEALALAFPLALFLLMVLGLLQSAVPLPPEDLSYRHVWGMMPLLYVIGLARARRRYR